MKISGSIIHAYIICPRKAWLMSRNISGNQDNDFLSIGKLLSEETYKREKKEIIVGSNKIDVIRNDDGTVVLIEVKKSSKMIKASEAQLLFYLYSFKDKFENIRGELRIPKEKKIIPVDLTAGRVEEIESIIMKLENLLVYEKAPIGENKNICKSCSYQEFCWS